MDRHFGEKNNKFDPGLAIIDQYTASIGCPSPLQVTGVEHEMRELLSEVAREKRNMETKFQKLLRAFQEVRLYSSD